MVIENIRNDAQIQLIQTQPDKMVIYKNPGNLAQVRYREFDVKVTTGIMERFDITLSAETEIERANFTIQGFVNGTLNAIVPVTVNLSGPSNGAQTIQVTPAIIQSLFGGNHNKLLALEGIRVRENFYVVNCSPLVSDATTFGINWYCYNQGNASCSATTTQRTIDVAAGSKGTFMHAIYSSPFELCPGAPSNFIIKFTNQTDALHAYGSNTKKLHTITYRYDNSWFSTPTGIYLEDLTTHQHIPVSTWTNFYYHDPVTHKVTLNFDMITTDPFPGQTTDALEDAFIRDNKYNEFMEGKIFGIVYEGVNFQCNAGDFYSGHDFTSDNKSGYEFMILGHDAADYHVVSFDDMCGINFPAENHIMTYANQFPVTSFAETDVTDLESGDPIKLDFFYQYSGDLPYPPNTIPNTPFRFLPQSNLTHDVLMCPNVTYQAIVSISTWYIVNSVLYYSDPNSSSGTTVTLFDLNQTDPLHPLNKLYRVDGATIGMNGKITVNATLTTCPLNTGGWDYFNAKIKAICNGCNACAYTITTMQTQVMHHCPGYCAWTPFASSPQGTNDFSFDRSTFGWTNSSMSTAATSATPNVSLNRAYGCDEIHITSPGELNILPLANFLSFLIKYDHPSSNFQYFEFVTCSLTYTTFGGSPTTIILSSSDVDVAFNLDDDYCPANQPCSLMVKLMHNPTTLHNWQNAGVTTLYLDMTLRVKTMSNTTSPPGSVPGADYYHLPQVRGEYYSDHGGSCDDWGDNMMVLNTGISSVNTITTDTESGFSAGLCHKYFKFISTVIGGLPKLDDFPNEFRPVIQWPGQSANINDKIALTLPPIPFSGTYDLNSALFRAPGIGLSTAVPVNVTVQNNGKKAIFNGYMSGSNTISFPIMEKNGASTEMMLYGTVTNTCPVPSGTSPLPQYTTRFPYKYRDYIAPIYGTNNCTYTHSDGTWDYPPSDPYQMQINTLVPSVDLTSTVANINNLELKLTFNGYGSISVNNAWLQFNTPGITVNSVSIFDGYTYIPLTPQNGYWQIGIPIVYSHGAYPIRMNITMNTTNPCASKTISVTAGYNCAGFPSAFSACTNSAQSSFTVVPKSSDIEVDVFPPVPNSGAVCNNYTFRVRITSTMPGDAENPMLDVMLPPNVFIANSYCIKSNTTSQLPIFPTGSNYNYSFNLNASNIYGGNGLPGNGSYVDVFITVQASCDLQGLSSGAFTFYGHALNVCGLLIDDESDDNEILSFTADPLPGSSNPVVTLTPGSNCTDPIDFTIQVNGIYGNGTGLSGVVTATFDPSFSVTTSNPAGTSGSGSMQWTYSNLQGTDSITITGQIQPPAGFCSSFTFPVTISLTEIPTSCCNSFSAAANPVSSVDFSMCCSSEGFCFYIPQRGNFDSGNEIMAFDDGGYGIAASLHQEECDRDLYYLRYDSQNNMMHNLLTGDKLPGCENVYQEDGKSVMQRIEDEDGLSVKYYYMAGNVELTPDNTDIVVTKLREDGSVVWIYRYNPSESDRQEIVTKIIDAYPMCNDHLLVVGYTNSFEENPNLTDMFALQLRPNGTIANFKTYGETFRSDKAFDVMVKGEACYLAGETTGEIDKDVYVVKINGKLDPMASLKVHGENDESAKSVTFLGDELYYAGYSRSFSQSHDQDVYLVKSDLNLNLIGTKNIWY
jgi:hypothetical protein